MAFEQEQIGRISSDGTEQPKRPTKESVKAAQEQEKVMREREVLEEERIYRRGVVSIKDVVAPAGMKIEPSFLRLGETYVRTIFVITYPRYISLGWFSPIVNMNTTLDVAMFFYPVKAAVILKQLKKKVGMLEAQIISDSDKGAPRDPIRETALKDIEELRDNLSQGIEHFFQFALYVTLYANSKDELDRQSEEVETMFGGKLIYSKRVFYQAEQGFNSTLPLGNDELMISFNMNSSPIASSFPFISADLTSENGVLFGINRHNNSLILFDRFSMQNANLVVFATSGAGKSFAVKLEILRSLMLGTEVIVIDPEMEYKHLSDAVGGTYINVSLASDAKINPFDLPRPVGEEISTEDIIRSAVITVKGLLRIMLGQVTPQEDSVLDRALLETYAKKDITPDSDLATAEPPIIQDLVDVLEGMEGTTDLVVKLRKFTDGTFSGLFNSPTTVQVKNILVTFSVRDLEDELRPLAIYAIINYIWNVVRSERKKRILVIDEAWWLMQHEDSARFIFALVKRCRKYYLGVTTITQDVNDFLRSPYGQAIVTNSAMQLLLRQSPAAIDNIQKTFLLTEGEKFLLLEGGVGEGIFFAGNKHAAIKVVASYSEDQIVTTNPQQLLDIERAKKEYEESTGSFESDIEAGVSGTI
ncbi:conjugal transfer protein TraC [Candidatus Uhrbacteria bacterium RIFOXYC2_FULL_47_19]|uniref:Conjugal transfer protein TraC n=1 Tax=Candidatus Uhrbacteria bacterium RIFOXYC2_FULL_47_19 TaxID=1802424 RepID=A0A1F7WBG1_9BACT|nr:MAG: conjugal transfer protein TraC [Candidatus Uhrbacteria bacterium RIFOXYC2_FULL_47_19]